MKPLLAPLMLAAGLVLSVPAHADDAMVGEMQALEAQRNAAIRANDVEALRRIYAADFEGVTSGGFLVHRDDLLAIFARNAANPGASAAKVESTVRTARREGEVIVVRGRIKISTPDRVVDDSVYMHVFRRSGDHGEMFAGLSTRAAS